MMSKTIKYIIGIIFVFIVIFLSLDIQNLEEYKATAKTASFNAESYFNDIWQNQVPNTVNEASDISTLMSLLNTNPDDAFKQFGRKLGISKTYYFMAKGEGLVESVEEEFIKVALNEKTTIQIATEFIFGNAVREGIGIVNIGDFVNMTDFNQVSVSLNKKVKSEVVSNLKTQARKGSIINFVGVFEINEDKVNLQSIRVIPISAKVSNGE